MVPWCSVTSRIEWPQCSWVRIRPKPFSEVAHSGKVLTQIVPPSTQGGINGYLVCSYKRRVWLHPAICYQTIVTRGNV